jgi:hypothetical protein
MKSPLALLGALLALGVLVPGGARAAELDAYAGRLQATGGGDDATSWAIEYRQSLAEHFAASFSWLNEGHLPLNHRDGPAAQLWWRSRADGPGLMFEAGLGAYRAYDGTWEPGGYYPVVAHRWAGLGSAAVDWYFGNGWFAYLRANRVQAISDFSSTGLVAGVGYHFADRAGLAAAADAAAGDGSALRWEIDGYYGTRIPNSHPTPHDASDGFDVRGKLTDHVALSFTTLNVGGQPFDWHHGVALQLWLEQQLGASLSVGASVGALLTKIPPTPPGYDPSERGLILDNSSLPFLVTGVTVGYALTPRWVARVVWDRVAGGFSDCDIYLVGAGYRF